MFTDLQDAEDFMSSTDAILGTPKPLNQNKMKEKDYTVKEDMICPVTNQHCDDEYEQEDIYRCQFLQAFEMEEWDDDVINKKIDVLFNKIKDMKEFDVIFDKLLKSKNYVLFLWVMGQDKLTLFKLLFKYELFHMTHDMLCSYLNKNVLSLTALEEAIL